MAVERGIRAIAGFFIMLSIVLSKYHHPYWIYFTFFVGLNLFQFAFTNFCPMVLILKKLGFKEAAENCCCSDSEREKKE